MGLLEPHGRHRRRAGEGDLTKVSCPGRGAACLHGAPQSRDPYLTRVGPGSAQRHFAPLVAPGTRECPMANKFRTLDDVDVKGKRVLLRVDLNVPMDNGRVSDATRLERVAPTITEISDKGGKVILLAHFGRPKGRDPKESLKSVAEALSKVVNKPVIAIIGGAKVSTKIDLLENLVNKVDALVIGGGMANTFLHAQGVGIGKSLAEKDLAPTALRIMEKAEAANCAIILPVDATVAYHFAANAPSHAYGLDAIPADGMILDVGPQSIARIHAAIDDAATLVWNGPLGAFEMTPFDRGTMVAAKHAAERTKAKKLISIAGGGDTVAALNQAHVAGQFTYVSTAGGAFLEWMEGKPLPGVEVLRIK